MAGMMDAADERVVGRVMRRLIPFCIACYLLNYLDRVNISIAKLNMQAPVAAGGVPGFTEAVFGNGAAIFFLGYFLFEVPSNLIQEKVGARRWIARIMITWGLVSMGFVLVRGEWSFYGLRFLLGLAEAGFFPGMILYLSHWVPRRYRARAAAAFLTSTAIAGVIGNPLGGFILYAADKHPLWLHSWQWLFIVEGVPAVVMGLVTLLFLNDRPSQAQWLSAEERGRLEAVLARDQEDHPGSELSQLEDAFRTGSTWFLAILYAVMIFGFYTANYYTPTIVKQMLTAAGTIDKATPQHVVYLVVGLLAAIPFGVATVGMVLIGRSSDRHGERRWHLVFACVLQAVGMLVAAVGCRGSGAWATWVTIGGLAVGAIGAFGMFGPFWALPTELLTGTAVAASVAVINSIGNLFGGFMGNKAYAIWGMQPVLLMATGLAVVGAVMAAVGVGRRARSSQGVLALSVMEAVPETVRGAGEEP
ncbi:MAG TPA: MFS transporter [Phycisphaerae bacterium]|nr:MFS transporter [Phycisphaerae bacterium]